MTDKKRWCPIIKDVCGNEIAGSNRECTNCPLDSLRTIADSLKTQQEQGTEVMNFSRGFLGKIVPGMADGFPGVAERDLPKMTNKKWWPEILICKKCGAEIVIVEEPKQVEVLCPMCGEENVITAVR